MKLQKNGKVTAVVAVMSIHSKKDAICRTLSPRMRSLLAKRRKVPISRRKIPWTKKPFSISQKMRKGRLPKKLASKSKKLKLNSTNLKLKSKKTRSDCTKKPDPCISSGLKVKNKTIRVLLDSGSCGDLLFMKKGSSKGFSVAKWVVPQSWGTSNGTFVIDMVADIEISSVEYSASKKVHLQPDIVEYRLGDQAPMYDLIIYHNRQADNARPRGSIGLPREYNKN